MIALADTSVSRKANLYRFQVETYPQYEILRMYENNGRKGAEKRMKTVSDGYGRYYSAMRETGEIVRQRKAFEIRNLVDMSIRRTHRVMREILMANKWNFFLTLTFNNELQDRTDDKAVKRHWDNFRRSVHRKYPKMCYMAVMERHKDGCIHFHLVVGGVSAAELKLKDSGHRDKSGRTIYNCFAWKYGFSTVTEVGDTEKVSGYLLKYIGKDSGVNEDFKKRYWCSRNCNRPRKRFIDFVSDVKEKVLNVFHRVVDFSVTMATQFFHAGKNYLVVRDNMPSCRKRFTFEKIGLKIFGNIWQVPCT